MRVAARYGSRDGYFDNVITGREMGNLDDSWEGRATLRWAPDHLPLTLTLSADANKWSNDGQGSVLRGYNAGLFSVIGGGLPSAAPYLYHEGVNYDSVYANPTTSVAEINTPNNDGRTGGVSVTLDMELGAWDIKSITAWRQNDANNAYDMDSTPLNLLAFAARYRQDQISEELQASTTIGNLDLITGLYFLKEDGTETVRSSPFGILGVPPQADFGEFEAESTGVFLQGNYSFTDRLRGTIGYRYTWDTRDVIRRGISNLAAPNSCTPPIPLVNGVCYLPLSADFEYPAWTIGLDYRLTDDAFVYVKSSRASVAGGFNLRVTPAGLESYDPQQVTDVEIGAKIDAFGGRLRTNLAIFQAETIDAQSIVNGLVGTRLTQWTQNAGAIDTTGVEIEVTALPWEGMEVALGAAYLDASYQSGTFIENRGTVAVPILVDRSAEEVPQAPEWSFNIGLTQRFELPYGRLTAHVDYSYFDEKTIFGATASPGASPATIAAVAEENRLSRTDAYSLVNGQLSLDMPNGIEVSLWGRNLADEEYLTYLFDTYNSQGFVSGNQGAPLTYGVGLRYNF